MSQYNRAKTSNTLTLELLDQTKGRKNKKKENDILEEDIYQVKVKLRKLLIDYENNNKLRKELENKIVENNNKIFNLIDTSETKKYDNSCCSNININESTLDKEKIKLDLENEESENEIINLQFKKKKILETINKLQKKLENQKKDLTISNLSLGGKKKKRKTKKNKVRKNKTKRKYH